MHQNPYQIKILKTIQKLGYRHSTWTLFSDFVELGALCIANSTSCGTPDWGKREKQYLDIIGKYQPDEQKLFPEMFADLVQALEYEITWSNNPVDILGQIYHELELHNKWKGQFFTPQNVCDMMGKIALGDSRELIEKYGYIGMSEPCVGSGAMVFGFARAMFEAELNYCKQLFVLATDIDIKCVHMAYLQLSLYGIPAVVTHGNTLTLEEWSRWYTPIYIIHGWRRKVATTRALEVLSEIMPLEKPELEPPKTEAPKPAQGFGQLSLFDEGGS